MTLDILIMLLGAFVALVPFLGFPASWDRVILVIAGVLIVILGIVVRRRSADEHMSDRRETFVQSGASAEHEA